jgi:hypothetical protein
MARKEYYPCVRFVERREDNADLKRLVLVGTVFPVKRKRNEML